MKYSKENLEKHVKDCITISDLVRKIKNSDTISPSSINLVSKKLKEYQIDTSHFIGSLKSVDNLLHECKSYIDVLVHDESKVNRTKRSLLLKSIEAEGSLKYLCSLCGNNGIHLNKPLLLQIDHIDGNWKNNLITNLRFLCPNCHSQTETYGFKESKY